SDLAERQEDLGKAKMFRPARSEIDWDTEKKKVGDAVRYSILSFAVLVAAIRITPMIMVNYLGKK
ncbi:hypothetical protein Bhyg_16054, partial [Pseudolycoriella hygida]